MFDRDFHHVVLKVLGYLDADTLVENGFYFGGGTRIVLEIDEFRESRDIDFLCSSKEGYAELRLLARDRAYAGLFRQEGISELTFPREMRIDQYGIRFPVVYGQTTVKIELIREGRIALGSPEHPSWSPVACLSIADCFAVKLLANSDRWPDRQVLSRDLIDLGALRRRFGAIPDESWRKAEGAYKSAVRTDLVKALRLLLDHKDFQDRCFQGLKITATEEILHSLAELARDLGEDAAQVPR